MATIEDLNITIGENGPETFVPSAYKETIYKESLAEKLKVASSVYFGFMKAKSENYVLMTKDNEEEMNIYFKESGKTILHLLKEMRK